MRTIIYEIDFYTVDGDLICTDQIESTPAENTISAIGNAVSNVRIWAREKAAEIGAAYALGEWETISGKRRVFVIDWD